MVMHALPRNFRLSVEFESCALLHAAGRLGRPPPSLLGRRDVGCAHDLRLKCPQSDGVLTERKHLTVARWETTDNVARHRWCRNRHGDHRQSGQGS